ncbi:MAG TPA: glycosyltransferase family 9 protein [Chitinispirillaceae bacterium]|nr:glycosyltransferase family 9 protein [Chitinispirillaceae bacterium]
MQALVYHNGALGDFLTILPALQLYQSQIAADHTTLLCRKQFGELACAAGYAEKFLDINNFSFLFNTSGPDCRIDSFFTQFDHCLFFSAADSPLILNAQKYSHPKIVYQAPFPTKQVHIIDYHLSFFNNFTQKYSIPHPTLSHLFVSPADRPSLESAKNAIVIAPGSGSRCKNWPLERFQAVADHLVKRGFPVCWVAGECESDFEFRDRDQIVRESNLISLSRFLHDCRLYIGNDSGVTHLAAASHCPVISLFGASDPTIWSPRGASEVRCIRSTVCHEYCQTRNRKFDCDIECMKSIQIEAVIATINEVLAM